MAISPRKTVYRGYQTVGQTKLIRLYDVELVIQDLFNIINTRKNERVRNAMFGSSLQDLIFEMNNDVNTQKVYNEVLRILRTEPRVRVIDVNIDTQTEYQVIVTANLFYVGNDVQFEFRLKFDKENRIIENISEGTNE